MPLATTGWPRSSWASAGVGGVEEVVVRQVADRAATVVSGEHEVAEGGLMESLPDQAEGVAALNWVRNGRPGGGARELAEGDPNSQAP